MVCGALTLLKAILLKYEPHDLYNRIFYIIRETERILMAYKIHLSIFISLVFLSPFVMISDRSEVEWFAL